MGGGVWWRGVWLGVCVWGGGGGGGGGDYLQLVLPLFWKGIYSERKKKTFLLKQTPFQKWYHVRRRAMRKQIKLLIFLKNGGKSTVYPVLLRAEIIYEPTQDETYMACGPSAFAVWSMLRTESFFMRTAKALIRLGGCPGWSDSLLVAHAILYVLSCAGSYVIRATQITIE